MGEVRASMPGAPEDEPQRAGLAGPFGVAEFRALWAAELVSVAGDQLARVALTVLVYGRTDSAAWAAATYALTFLPALLGGVLLGRLADRYARRAVMISCDLARAGLVALMALPATPLWAVCALLVVVVLLAPPHSAAQCALLPQVLRGSLFEAGLALRQITNQAGQVAGFALGGVLVAVLSPGAALAIDAATFAVSAFVLRVGVRARPAPTPPGPPTVAGSSWIDEIGGGLRAVFGHPRRLLLAAAVWLVGCYVLPEALAAPYAAQLGAGPALVGALMAADPAGSVVGVWLFTRFAPERMRTRLIWPLALLAGLPLAACAFAPGPVASVLLWAVAGAGATACLVQAQAEFVRQTPDEMRGRAIAVAASGLVTAQGAAVLLGGVAAEAWTARDAVVVCGLLGALVAGGLAVASRRLELRVETAGAGTDVRVAP
jgi:predicted MFS family arabinose efflux permease